MRWYVFDQFDCFTNFPTAAEAAVEAEWMAGDGLQGVHIVQMTEAQFNAYCQHGDLKKALEVK